MKGHEGIRIDKAEIEKIQKEKELKKPETAKEKVPAKKVLLWTLGALIGIAYVLILVCGRFFIPADNKFYQSFDIFSDANPINLARMLSYALLILTAGAVLRIIIKGLRKNEKVTKKVGKAILDLLGNLVKYVMYIIVICLALNAVGVDTTAILAGLGIVALVIGLGVTSLIEDIVAGIFIIAERMFDVGDIIVVDGFRGTVVSIGIRSTKIADIGNNVLTMRNSSIGSLVNLTDRKSCAAITFPLAPGESILKVEEAMKNSDFEKHAKETGHIEFALYLGACGINKWGVQELLFIAGCDEQKIYESERFLYREVSIIFEKAGIKVGGPVLEANE